MFQLTLTVSVDVRPDEYAAEPRGEEASDEQRADVHVVAEIQGVHVRALEPIRELYDQVDEEVVALKRFKRSGLGAHSIRLAPRLVPLDQQQEQR